MKQLFTTEKGRAVIEALKQRFDHFVIKGDREKAELCERVITKLVTTKKNIKSEISSVVKVCRLLKGIYTTFLS